MRESKALEKNGFWNTRIPLTTVYSHFMLKYIKRVNPSVNND